MVIYGYCIFETSPMAKILCDIPIHIHSVCVCVCVYEIPSLLSLIPSLLLLYSISCSLSLSHSLT